MEIAWTILLGLVICVSTMTGCSLAEADTEDKEYTNMWIAEVRGGEHVARRIARELGYTFGGQADVFEDHYVFKRDDHPEVSKRGSHHLTRSLVDVEDVLWAEQQSVVRRTKRGIVPEPPASEKQTENVSKRDLFSSPFFSKPSFKSSPFGGGRPFGSGRPFSFSGFGGGRPSLFSSPSFSSYGGSFKPVPIGSLFSSSSSSSSSSNDDDDDNSRESSSSSSDSSKSGSYPTTPLDGSSLNKYSGPTKNIGCHSRKTSAYAKEFNDPLWTKQWYAQDYRTDNVPVMDLNLVPVYRMGITGKSIKVAVVDDGLQHGHPDLNGNFMPDMSYDMCNDQPGSDPDPSSGSPNSHGTKCAGEIAMVANNGKCGVGVAYNAKVAGVKVLGRRSVDYVEARGLVWKLNVFDIYSNSWGPADDGKTMEKVGRMSVKAFEKGVTEGRNGKGAIYVFAGGNGKHSGDNCAADGLINSPYTIAISSVSQNGKTVYYSERCSAIYAGAYSGGNTNDEKVATIDLNGGCTTSFSGTSAAAPIASGIIALTLEANPDLTYRDIYHIITMGTEVAPVADNGDIWYKNGKGFWVSNDFGFGILNAENMVKLAKNWKTVPPKNTCIVSVNLDEPQYFRVGEIADIQFETEACQDTEGDAVKYLEQIEVACNVQHQYRGAIKITITSPAGTKSTLMEPRPKDSSREGLEDWSIKSVHNWGEDPKGTWEIEVTAAAIPGVRQGSGYVNGFTITFHGTAEKPAHYDQLPRKYAAFRLPNGKTSEV